MSTHPKRFMADGTATTRRVDGVAPVECGNPNHVRCFVPLTSWAGEPNPRPNHGWHIYVSRSGAVSMLGTLVGRESAQLEAGMVRRVRHILEGEK